jgi:sucrose phosphorylase
MPRRVNRSRFERAELERKMSDSSSLGARVFARCRELLRARRACAAFHPQAAQEVLALDEHVFALLRSSPGHAGQVLCLHNLSNETVRLDAKPLLPESDWTPLVGSPDLGSCPSGVITLEPYQIAWLADTRAG